MKTPRRKRFWIAGLSLFGSALLLIFVSAVALAQTLLPGLPLTTDPSNDLRPTWSPDGSQIAFFSLRSGNYDIWLMDADGNNQRQLTDDPADDRRPTWSPDGKYIVFDSDRAGSRDVWILEIESRQTRQLTSGEAWDSFASWSPDGSQIAYFAYEGGVMDLWMIALEEFLQGGESGEPVRMTTGLADENQNGCTYGCHTPSWSPDSSQIALPSHNHSQIMLLDVAAGHTQLLSAGAHHEHFPTWTSDGRVLFLSERQSTAEDELVNDVWIIDADGSNAALLYESIPHGGPFYWNPTDISSIAFHSPRQGNFDIYSTVLGSEEQFVIEEEAPAEEPTPLPTQEVEAPPTEAPVQATSAPAADPVPAAEQPGDSLQLLLGWGAVAVAAAAVFVAAMYLIRRGR